MSYLTFNAYDFALCWNFLCGFRQNYSHWQLYQYITITLKQVDHEGNVRSPEELAKGINVIQNSKRPSHRFHPMHTITKTYLYNFDPLKPHIYIVKLGFTGVYIIFLISAQKHRLWVLVRTASPRRF